jgi:hypothetical protein
MRSTLSGMFIYGSSQQLENASSPITVTPEGICTDFNGVK